MNAARYRVQSIIRELYGYKFRFFAIQSTALDARKEKTITKQIEKKRKELEKACQNLEKRTFYCTPKRTVGRPKNNVVPETEITYRLNIDIQSPAEEKIADLRAKASAFILMTNVLKEEMLSAIDVLKEYKEQTAFVFLMALLIYALLERRVRHNLKEESEPLTLPGNRIHCK